MNHHPSPKMNPQERQEHSPDNDRAAAGVENWEADIIHPRPHPLRWLVSAAGLVVVLSIAVTVVRSPNLHWDVVAHYMVDSTILDGTLVTLALTAITMIFGIALGIVVALMRLSDIATLRSCAWLFVWFFRSTPLLVALVFWYNIALFFPVVELSLPFGPTLFSVSTNVLVTPFIAAIIAFSLNEAAYMTEIIRAGISSVPREQTDAALAIGMSRIMLFRCVVLPQALRAIVPPTGNEVVAVLKGTSLVFAISVGDLMTSAKTIYSGNYEVISLLVVVTIWYLILTSIFSAAQTLLERRLDRDGKKSGFWASFASNTVRMRPQQGRLTK